MNYPYQFPYQNYPTNPYNAPQQAFNQQGNQLIRVNGIEGAKAYQMQYPNSTVALFDANNDLLYIKSTDGACFPTIRSFKFEEVAENTNVTATADYVSRNEFEDFKKEITTYAKQFVSKSEIITTNDSPSKTSNGEHQRR